MPREIGDGMTVARWIEPPPQAVTLRPTRRAWTAAMLVLCALTAGCGTSSPTSDRPASGATGTPFAGQPPPTKGTTGHVTYRPLPPGGYRVESLGLDLVPSSADPDITMDDAIAAVEAAKAKPNSAAPTGALMTATDGDWGIGQVTDQNSFTDRLSWLLTYPNSEMILRGPSMTAEKRRRIAASLTCTDFRLVDARTAKLLMNYQSCG